MGWICNMHGGTKKCIQYKQEISRETRQRHYRNTTWGWMERSDSRLGPVAGFGLYYHKLLIYVIGPSAYSGELGYHTYSVHREVYRVAAFANKVLPKGAQAILFFKSLTLHSYLAIVSTAHVRSGTRLPWPFWHVRVLVGLFNDAVSTPDLTGKIGGEMGWGVSMKGKLRHFEVRVAQ
jgi:hypothetical protein